MRQKDVIVEIDNALIGYEKEKIIESVSWKIKRGEFWALIGENGAGKSSLAKAIAGLTEGVRGIKTYGKIIYLPQYLSREYVPLTVEEAISLYSISSKYVDIFNLNTYKSKRIDELSGGMAQSLFISLVLSQSADLYILDEPETSLDYEREKILYKLLEEKVKKKKAVIVITHDIDWVKKAIKHIACIHKKERRLLFHCPVLERDVMKVNHDVNIHY